MMFLCLGSFFVVSPQTRQFPPNTSSCNLKKGSFSWPYIESWRVCGFSGEVISSSGTSGGAWGEARTPFRTFSNLIHLCEKPHACRHLGGSGVEGCEPAPTVLLGTENEPFATPAGTPWHLRSIRATHIIVLGAATTVKALGGALFPASSDIPRRSPPPRLCRPTAFQLRGRKSALVVF